MERLSLLTCSIDECFFSLLLLAVLVIVMRTKTCYYLFEIKQTVFSYCLTKKRCVRNANNTQSCIDFYQHEIDSNV